MNPNYSQKDRERGYLTCRRLTPSSFLKLSNSIDVPQLLNYLGLIKGYKTQYIRERKQYYIRCPFHQERSPSCCIDSVKGFFYCFGCHQKGDLVKFTAEVQGKGYMHAIGTLRELFRVKGLEYENILTPIPEVLQAVKESIIFFLSQASEYQPVYYDTGEKRVSLQEYVVEVRETGIIDRYLHDFLIHNKLKQLYTISQFASDVTGIPSGKRDYRGYTLTREFLEYLDARRSGEDWEDFLASSYGRSCEEVLDDD